MYILFWNAVFSPAQEGYRRNRGCLEMENENDYYKNENASRPAEI